MRSVRGIYDGTIVKPVEPIPVKAPANVLITTLDDAEDIQLLKMKEESLSKYWNSPELDVYNED
ncbi:MAG: hypothetical protein COS84_01355 [Armatimonadetes bacterium CG07_land_8_20_14_0_80_40_9]|nr:MAG: hypothetical protein COS84_01355 [Armatimonadetes bacterium CG07_land_8_20_14_0_80_40_9]